MLQIDYIVTLIKLKGNRVIYKNFQTYGHPYIMVAKKGKFKIDKGFIMNNNIKSNPIGSYRKCTFFVNNSACLEIGENVGISQTALICHHKITIGNNVMIGGGTSIFDTDFHSLDYHKRLSPDDFKYVKFASVDIGDNVFIGAHSIILKGVSIGANAIIGAGSVVSKSIPANEIWAGNPAKFIRKIHSS